MINDRKKEFDKHNLIDKKEWNINQQTTKEEKLDKSWFDKLQIVLKYIEINEKNPILSDKKNGGTWLKIQFENYRKGKITKERKEEFDKHNLIDKKEWDKNKKD